MARSGASFMRFVIAGFSTARSKVFWMMKPTVTGWLCNLGGSGELDGESLNSPLVHRGKNGATQDDRSAWHPVKDRRRGGLLRQRSPGFCSTNFFPIIG